MKNPFFVFGRNRIFFAVSFVFAVFSAFAFFACSDELLSAPESSESSSGISASKVIVAPASLSATHGTLRGVQLSWKSSEGASRYKIYSADSPFSSFIQIGEASGDENFFTASENSGVSKYYKVKAVDSSLSESSFSNVAFGSSLATPIITSIEMGSDGTSATVKWWMENCTGETYESNVLYEISAYGTDRTTLVSSTTSSASNLSATLTNLEPKTNYFFRVDAFLSTDQTSIESSDLVDKETARKLIPNPVENLCVDQGVSENSVNLSFTLPEKCDVSVGNGAYEQHPLYFVISRKEKDKSDSSFSVIETVRTWDSSDYSTYIAGDTYSYSDSDVSRGKQYTYKIQSYVDDTKRTISSSDSIVTEDGWCVSVPTLRVTSSYTKSDDGANFTSIMFAFASSFEDFGKSYEYILKIEKSSLDDENAVSSISYNKFSTLSALNSFSQLFNNIDSASEGYYRYSLSVCAENASDAAESYTTVVAPGKYIVTNDASKVPQIENFTVEDGYKDKFVLKWKYNESYAYTIKWTPVDDDGVLSNEESLELSVSDFANVANGAEFSFEHTAVSGDRRIYELIASNGLEADASPSNAPSDKIFETLGTAKIALGEKDYDKISFSFPKVQKADSYEISAKYSESGDAIENNIVATESDDGIMVCTIENPAGYDDATRSGKDVLLTVEAKNATTNSATKSLGTTSTLGPALTTVSAEGFASSISVSWKKVPDVDGYLVYRTIYKDADAENILAGDSIYVSESELSAKVNGDDVSSSVISLNSDTFTLKDNYSEAESDSSYLSHQSKIPWGVPFGYFVVPVKNDSDFAFSISSDSKSVSSSGKVQYRNINSKKVSAYGYGMNVKASKATSDSAVTVTWEKPFGADSKSAALYRKTHSDDDWTYLKTLDKGIDSCSYAVSGETKPYEYAVLYNGANSNGKVFEKSFLDSLSSAVDSNNEQDNKGYILSLFGVEATTGSGYSENIAWTPYDFENRAVGPDYYELQIKNYNKAQTWTTIARIEPDTANGDKGKEAVLMNADANKISLSSGNYTATATPVFDSDNCTSGVMQVLRDTRHFYRLVAYRTFKNANEESVTISANSAESDAVYREITNEELSKCVNLIIADALYKSGIPYESNLIQGTQENTVSGNSGTFKISGTINNWLDYKNKVSWSFSNFRNTFKNGTSSANSEEYISPFTLNSGSCSEDVGIDGHTLYHLPTLAITTTHESGLSSYEKTVNVTVGKSGNSTVYYLKIDVGGTSIIDKTCSSKAEFEKFFPYDIGNKHEGADSSLNSEFVIYNSPWWN